MTLVQSNKGKLVFQCIIVAILFLIIDMYYLHINYQNSNLGIASNNLLFAMTSLLGIPLLITGEQLLKNYYNEKVQEKVADSLGYTAIVALLIGAFTSKVAPLWMSDLMVQILIIGTIGCFTITPKKGNYVIALICALITFAVIIVYFRNRF